MIHPSFKTDPATADFICKSAQVLAFATFSLPVIPSVVETEPHDFHSNCGVKVSNDKVKFI